MPRQSLKDAVNEWLESFSLSQLKNIPRTKNIYWQLFWFLTFLITLGCGIWKSYGEVQKYLDYPFDTYKRFEPSLSTPFPAVTICNLNPMSQENGNYIRQVKELMTVYRYHLSLIAEKEAKNAADLGENESDKSRNKRTADVTTLWVVPPGSDLRKCESTTFESTFSPTTTSATTTELPATTKTTTKQYTIAPSTTTTEIPVPTTTVHQTTTNAPTSTEETEPTSTITEATVPKTTVRPKPTTTYASTTEVPSSTPLSTAPQKTKPGTTVTQESETEIPSSETARTQTEELSTVQSTVKYTESTSENPASTITTTSKSESTTGKSTKSSTSTEYLKTETYTSEIPSRVPSSTTPPVKYSATEEKEITASTTANIGDLNDKTSKAANVEFSTPNPSTIEVQTTKRSMVKVQTTTTQSNEFITTKPKNVEIPTTEQNSVDSTTKSSNTDVQTPKTESTKSASRESSTAQPTTKSVSNVIVTDDPESSTSNTISFEYPNDQTTKATAVKYTTRESIKSKTTESRSTASNQNEIKNQTTRFTTQTPSQEQNANYSPSSSTPSDSSTTTVTKQTPVITTPHSSSSTKPTDHSATSTSKTMLTPKQSTKLPATPLTSESSKQTSKSTTAFSATPTISSEKRTTKSEADENETTKLDTTVPPSLSTPIFLTTKFTPQITIQEEDDKYSSTTIEGSESTTATTVTKQISEQPTTSSTTASSKNTATTSTIQTSLFSAPAAAKQSTVSATKSTVNSATTLTSTQSSTQEPHPTSNNFKETSTTPGIISSMPNEATVTQKQSTYSTVSGKATSETNNQQSSPSTTPSPDAQLTTADPVIFEGLTKSEMDELTEKYQIVPDSSRISLESQAKGRLLSMANSNLSSGYAVNDIIISCTYNMISCDLEKDFSKMTDPWFGNCYTFNYDAKHLIVGAGNKYGLKIVAFSNVTEYLPTSSAAGMKVVVHKQNFDPFPNNEGIYASVGSHVDVNVRYKSLEQLTAPYGVCRHENDTAGYIYDGRYRIEGCYRSCFQQRIIDDCQCADPRFPKPRGSNISFCDVSNVTGFTCYVRYLSTKGDFMHVKNCVCPHGCTEPDYTLDVWPSKWPIKKNNFTTPKCWGNYSNTKIDCLKAYKDNAVSIDVTHKYMFYRRTYEQASFSVMDLILEIAGNLGLWTGFSMLVLGEIFHIFFFIFSRPNVDARVEDIEMSNMSNQNTTDIYDSQNIADEYENDVPRPIISHALNAGGLIQGVPSSNDNVSSESESESEDEDFDLIEPDSCAAFLVKPELLYDISKEFKDDATDDSVSEDKPKPLQGSKLVDRIYLELKKAGKIQPMCPVNFKKYHFAVPSNYKSDASSSCHASDSGITQNLSSNYSENETEDYKDPDVHHGKSIQPMLLRDLSPEIENLEMTGLPQSRCPFPPIKGFVRTLADVPVDYRPYISNGRLCFPNTRKYYFSNETQTDALQSTSTKNLPLIDDETQSSSSSYKNT